MQAMQNLADEYMNASKNLRSEAQMLITRAEVFESCSYGIRSVLERERAKAEKATADAQEVAYAVGSP